MKRQRQEKGKEKVSDHYLLFREWKEENKEEEIYYK